MGEKIQNNLNNILTVIFYDFIEFYSARKFDQYFKKNNSYIVSWCIAQFPSYRDIVSSADARLGHLSTSSFQTYNYFLQNSNIIFLLGKFGNSSYIQKAEGSQMSYCDLTFFTQGKCFLIVYILIFCVIKYSEIHCFKS